MRDLTLFATLLLVMLCLKFLATTLLDILNLKNIKKNSESVPEAFSNFMDFPTYKKAVSYSLDKIKFAIFENFANTILLAFILVLWILPILFDYGTSVFGFSVAGQAVTIILITVILSIPELPFELYNQFVIEQEYGFNKSTIKLWIVDKIKSFFVGLIIGAPILSLIIFFTESFPQTWWIWAFIAVSIFQVVMIIVYPRFIIPLFNKLEDLPEGELRSGLFSVADKGGFHAETIQVIDGSKRSSHSNAYFTGFGKFRRIVLFDTLIDQLTQPEIEAVLAHEIGHYKRGHIVKMLIMNFAMMFVTFAVMGWLSMSEWFYLGSGFCEATGFGPVLLMFSLFAGLFTFWLTPIMNLFSRANEFEADAFAANICDAQELKSALRKLHKKNLGNLTPHPIYSAFYYSHPTLLERESALDENIKK